MLTTPPPSFEPPANVPPPLRSVRDAVPVRRCEDTGERLESWLAMQQKNCRAGEL